MEQKRFTKNDCAFVCANCGTEVQPLGYTSRNHCPKCLCSLHVDVLPGDRQNECGGIMDPVAALPDPDRGYILLHQCRRCQTIVRNRAAHEAKVQPDDLKYLIRLTSHPIPAEPKSKGKGRFHK